MRVPFALAAGAGVGALAVTAYGVAPMLTTPEYVDRAVIFAPLIFIVAFITWAIGLLIVGGPAWIILTRIRRTAPTHALLLGLIAPFVVSVLLPLVLSGDLIELGENGRDIIRGGWRTPYGWFVLIKDAVLLAMAGGVVAMVIWWVAYPKERAGA